MTIKVILRKFIAKDKEMESFFTANQNLINLCVTQVINKETLFSLIKQCLANLIV